LDTGASRSPAACPVAGSVRAIIDRWLVDHHRNEISLIVAHSHSHGDHTSGDRQFAGQSDVTIVPLGVEGVSQFFGITGWPDQVVSFDLGRRMLEIVPIPGHESSHIAVYDPRAKLLLTGDSLYPGLLVVDDWDKYRESVTRLEAFADTREIAHI